MNSAANLLVFLSDRCNMACDYCFLDLNHDPATVLDAQAGRLALRAHARNGGRSVAFLGGEPLIHYGLLLELAEAARRETPGLRLNLTTNGTLLDARRLESLYALGVDVTVSIDGTAPAHDRHRRLLSGAGSARAAALAGLPAAERAALKANLVVCPDTAAAPAENVEQVRRLGFRRVTFHLDVAGDWNAVALRDLERGAAGLVRYWRDLPRAAHEEFRIANLEALASLACDRCCDGLDHCYEDLVLGADGRYYPCDAFFRLPYAEAARWSVGAALSGVDWGRRARVHAQALVAIHAALERPLHFNCPRETYFLALTAGRDPAEAVRGYHRADNILGDALAALSAQGEALHV